MVRTQIQLTEDQHQLLKRLAQEENKSMAEIIRMAVDLLESKREASSSAAIRERAKRAAGRFSSGLGDVAARHNDYFADSILP